MTHGPWLIGFIQFLLLISKPGTKVWELQNGLRGTPPLKTPPNKPQQNSLCISAETKRPASANMNVRFLFFPHQSSGRTFPAGPGSGRRCCALLMAGSPRTLPTPAAAPRHSGPLAGVPVLLVAHQWAVVAQDLHRVLPVPTRAAEILEADLWAEHRGNIGVYPAAKGHSSLFLTAWFCSPHQHTGSVG